MSKISSHHDHLHYGKMAAVSVRHMCTGSYAPLIALLTLSITNTQQHLYTSLIHYTVKWLATSQYICLYQVIA